MEARAVTAAGLNTLSLRLVPLTGSGVTLGAVLRLRQEEPQRDRICFLPQRIGDIWLRR